MSRLSSWSNGTPAQLSAQLLPLFCAGAMFSLSACSAEPERYVLTFAPVVGDQPFACGKSYEHIGTHDSTFTPLDFRMYVHDVTLLRADGESVPLTLEQDGKWQRDAVALLDFEDSSGACETGSPETHTVITGSAPVGDYTGVAFTVGIPEAYNHLDAATAPSPFNIPGLWWSWSGGYKYARLDVQTAANPSFYFHLGATNCSGDSIVGYNCNYSNLARISLTDLNPETDTIRLDVKELYRDSDLEASVDYVTDYISGCMAFSGDPECEAIFNKLGMTFEEAQASPPTQSFFLKQ
ncbi:MAG: MbnP family copper-binding protein [Myxococcota bacterium]